MPPAVKNQTPAPPAEEAKPVKLPENLTFAEEAYTPIEDLLDDADKLHQEKEGLFARIEANRNLLRNYITTGRASKEQAEEAYRRYPLREVKPKSETNGAAS